MGFKATLVQVNKQNLNDKVDLISFKIQKKKTLASSCSASLPALVQTPSCQAKNITFYYTNSTCAFCAQNSNSEQKGVPSHFTFIFLEKVKFDTISRISQVWLQLLMPHKISKDWMHDSLVWKETKVYSRGVREWPSTSSEWAVPIHAGAQAPLKCKWFKFCK